jgi:hypothetical protein
MSIKLIIAGLLELGNDEVYYWTYALQLDWNHFDHPPLIGWMIRLTTLNLHWVSEISLRLGSILSASIATWFIYKTARLISSEKAGWYAAIIYQSSIYTGIIAGLFILPDSPQMPLWTAALYCMAVLLYKPQEERKTGTWILLGILIGLAALSKVHGLYLWVGFGLSILFLRIKWLLSWRFYMAVFITMLFLLPIVYWNIQYDFITYKFHSERVAHTQLQWDMLGREIAGEFAYQNPIVFILIIIALIAFAKNTFSFSNKDTSVWLFCMSFPMIFLFWVIALFNPTLPHWTGPAYIPLYLFAAIFLEKKSGIRTPRILSIAGFFVGTILLLATAIVRLAPVNFGSHEKENYGEYCPTLDLSGWSDFSNEYSKLVASDKQMHLMQPNSFIIVPKWFPGGHLEFYTASRTHQTLIAIGPLQDIHKFAWLNRERKKLQIGDDAYAIVPSNLPLDVVKQYAAYFTSIQAPVQINQIRNGGAVRYFYVYRLKGCKKIPQELIR